MTTERELEMAKAIDAAEAADRDDHDDVYARPKPPRRRAGDVYTFRLPPERRAQLRAAAEIRGVAPATLIREWVEACLDGDSRREAATRTIADMSSVLSSSSAVDVALVVPEFDVGIYHKAFADLVASAGVVSSFAAVTEGLHRTLSAALLELDVVKEHLVEAVIQGQSEPPGERPTKAASKS